jgi:ADP-heptose:LPS heptosyltransferase
MKFLILRFSSIGDIVLTTPVVRCLKKKFPDAEIHYATKKAYHSIVQHNPYIHKIHLLDESFSGLIEKLKAENFNYIIDLHHNLRTAVIKSRLRTKSFSFNKLNFDKWLMVNFKINWLPKTHIVDRYFATCNELGVVNDNKGLDYFITEDEKIDIKTLPHAFTNPYIGWVLGGLHKTKQFPAEKIIKALQQINYPVILLGGKDEFAEAENIISMVPEKTIFNACGKFTLNQSASLVAAALAVVSNDTGLMHIAAAFKKPVISLWGNTIPEFGMAPYYGNSPTNDIRLEVKNLSCRPCSKLGYNQCPEGHFKCMKQIDELKITDIINSGGLFL